jgi:hypothetical protein
MYHKSLTNLEIRINPSTYHRSLTNLENQNTANLPQDFDKLRKPEITIKKKMKIPTKRDKRANNNLQNAEV